MPFYKSEIKYLGYIISVMDFEWIPPKSRLFRVGQRQKKFETCSVQEGRPFVWGPEQKKSLQDLKTALLNSDFLTHPDDSRPFILETDASDYAIYGVLSQYDDSNTLRPIAFYARQMIALSKTMKFTTKSCWPSSIIQTLATFSPRRPPSCHRLMLLVFGAVRVRLFTHSSTWKTHGRADSLSRREDYKANTESSNFQRILDPQKVVDLQSLVADMDLHLLLHSQVLEKVFVLESDWPLIIADFLAGEDNVWMDDVPEVILERCKRELKHFRFRDNSFFGYWKMASPLLHM
ncbi:hypothetical protein BASA83_012796 [Batrachochytrium salamandrivorans]|nr:hypothetical protein BASA83_012796 [Batrachochytrium salamandrivorans]